MKRFKPSRFDGYLYLFLPLLFSLALNISRESDTWFLLSHGRYVFNNGIPYLEILSMHSDFTFIMQQWLSSLIFYVIYKFLGNIGLYIFYLLISYFILFLVYKLCMLISKNKSYISCLFSSVILLLLMLNFIELRPQLFSYSILLIVLIILEKYYSNMSSKLIYFLPLLSILLINFHAAMWPIMFILFLPFFAEYIFDCIKNKNIKINNKLTKLILIFVVCIIVGFINPYGIDAMTYSLKSYGVFGIEKQVAEMISFNLMTDNNYVKFNYLIFLGVFLLVNFIIMYFKDKNKLNIHIILLMYGLLFMGLFSFRNVGLFYLFFIPYVTKYINIKDYDKNKYFKNYIKYYSVFIIMFICLFSYNIYRGYYKLDTGINDLIKVLDKDCNKNKNIKLFTNYNMGSYFEYYGYKPYIDSRAEVFIKKLNNKEDVLKEYFKLCDGKLNIDKFINKYNFDYLVCDKGEYIYDYLKNNDNYEFIYINKNKDRITYLFKRKI